MNLTIVEQPDQVFYKDAVGGTKRNRLRMILSRRDTCNDPLNFILLQVDVQGKISTVTDQSILRMFPVDTSNPERIIVEFSITRVSQRQNRCPYALKITNMSDVVVSDPILVKSKRNMHSGGQYPNHKTILQWRHSLQQIIQSCQALDHKMQRSPSQTLDAYSTSIFEDIQ